MTKTFRTLDDVDVKGKRVLLRVDLNVPMENGRVTDATRLERVAPTITEISAKGGKVILLAHFGRPKGRDPQGIAEAGRSRTFAGDQQAGRVCRRMHRRGRAEGGRRDEGWRHPLPENTRFHKEEEKNDPAFVRSWQSSATSGSTTPSRRRTAPTPRPKASATDCPPMPAAPCRPNSTRSARRWITRPNR